MARKIARLFLLTILVLSQVKLGEAKTAELNSLIFPANNGHPTLMDFRLLEQEPTPFELLISTRCDFLSQFETVGRTQQSFPTSQSEPEFHPNDLPPRPVAEFTGCLFVELKSTSPTCPAETLKSLPQFNANVAVPTRFRTYGETWKRSWDWGTRTWDAISQAKSGIDHRLAVIQHRLANRFTSSTAALKDFATSRLAPLENEKTAVPVLRASHSRKTTDSKFDRAPHDHAGDAGTNEVPEQEPCYPEIQIEDFADPYWQYYEDCDRWGVSFALTQSQSLAENTSSAGMDWRVNADDSAFLNPLQTLKHIGTSMCPNFGPHAKQAFVRYAKLVEFHAVEFANVDVDLVEFGPKQPLIMRLIKTRALATAKGLGSRSREFLAATQQSAISRITEIVNQATVGLANETRAWVGQFDVLINTAWHWNSDVDSTFARTVKEIQ